MKQKLLLITCLILGFNRLFAQTTVNTNITSNQTWSPANSPYIISQNITVDATAKLTILPGTKIRNAGTFVITVLGGVEAIGKFDTLITIDSVKFHFNYSKMGYNFSNNTGSQFDYCKFRGYYGYMAIHVDETPLMVKHSTFTNFQYVARQVTATASSYIKLRFEDCTFDKGAYNSYIIWPFGTKTELEMERCTATNHQGGLMLADKNYFKNCYFFNWYGTMGFDLYSSRNAVFKCNTFRKFNKTILQFPIGGYYENTKFVFENNTLDSANTLMEYYVNTTMSNSGTGTWSVKNNNFLRFTNKLFVGIGKTNSGYVQTLNLQNNYWNTLDSPTIANGITDYNDNNFISVNVDFSNKLTSKSVGCPVDPVCPIPEFYMSYGDSTVTFIDSSKGSSSHKVRWDFGDGNTDNTNNKQPEHKYKDDGMYTVCMYVYNDNDVLCDSICKILNYVSNQCKASYYFGVDTSDKMNIYVFENSKVKPGQIKYFWSFGDGKTSSSRYPTHQYLGSGKYVVCLTITGDNCNSTFCDTVNVFKEGVKLNILQDPQSDIQSLNVNNFNVFPNPSEGVLNVQVAGFKSDDTRIDIMDINGRTLKSVNSLNFEMTDTVSIDLKELPQGIYYVKVSSAHFVETKVFSISK